MSVNKVILVGNVGRKPEIRYVGQRPVATFSLATTERGQKTADGTEMPERTEWHNLVMWDRAAEIAERYIDKGTKLFVERETPHTRMAGCQCYQTQHHRDICRHFDILSRKS